MLTIDRLSLALPPGFEDRAAALAERIAERLAALPLTAGAELGHLRIEHALDPADPSDEGIAAGVADALLGRLRAPHDGGAR